MAIKVIRAVAVECDDCGYTYDELDVTPAEEMEQDVPAGSGCPGTAPSRERQAAGGVGERRGSQKKQADILYELRGQKYEQTTAIDQLRAENERLKRGRDDAIRQLKFFAPCAGCKWYRGIIGCNTGPDYYKLVVREE